MSNSYVTLWTQGYCKWLQKVGDSRPLSLLFGGPHRSLPSVAHLKPGDLIYPVMIKDWTLFVTGRMRIKSIVPYEEYARDHPRMKVTGEVYLDATSGKFKPLGRHPGHRLPHGCIEHVAIGEAGTPLRFDNPVPPAILAALRLGPRPGRELPIKGIDGDRLTRSLSLQGHYRRLSEESASSLAGLVERRG